MVFLTGRLRRRPLLLAASLLPLSLLLVSCTTEDATSTAPAGGSGGEATATASSAAAMFETPRKPEGEVLIQIVTNGISPFWDPMAAGMKKAAEELGCKAEWSGPPNSEVGAQKQMVESALAKGADGIAISCIEPDASNPIVDAVLDKNVPIITFDSDAPKSRRLVYIGTNNFNAGKAAGEAAIKLLPNGGKFVGFVGNISAANARERRDGFVEATKGHNIELIEVIDDNKDPARARRNVEDAITKYGDQIQGLLGLYSYNGPAIVNAVMGQKGLREKYKIVAFDAEPVTLKELEKGNIDATVVQKPYDFGYLSTKLLYLINTRGFSAAKEEMKIPEDGIVDTGVKVITPANIADYKKELAEIGIASS
jgi:ribose transport system substrate-binding protein